MFEILVSILQSAQHFAQDAFSLIPDTGPLVLKFKTGEFVWNDIIVFGLYLVQLILGMAGVGAIISVMFGGYRYLMPTEDAKEKGKDTIKHALIGFAIIVLAWTIVDVIISLLIG